MSQLRMLWYPTNEMKLDYTLPEGFFIRPMDWDEIDAWNDVSTALIEGTVWTKDIFVREMLFNPPLPLSPKNIYCCYDKDGKMISTSAACFDPVTKKGDLHMVSGRQGYRGMGLGKAVCIECVKFFLAAGCVEADLSTDEFRKPAISIYLKLGFRPWLYEDDMRDRWIKTFEGMNLDYTGDVYLLSKEVSKLK